MYNCIIKASNFLITFCFTFTYTIYIKFYAIINLVYPYSNYCELWYSFLFISVYYKTFYFS